MGVNLVEISPHITYLFSIRSFICLADHTATIAYVNPEAFISRRKIVLLNILYYLRFSFGTEEWGFQGF